MLEILRLHLFFYQTTIKNNTIENSIYVNILVFSPIFWEIIRKNQKTTIFKSKMLLNSLLYLFFFNREYNLW